jgi:hypothetical protein
MIGLTVHILTHTHTINSLCRNFSIESVKFSRVCGNYTRIFNAFNAKISVKGIYVFCIFMVSYFITFTLREDINEGYYIL